MDPRQDTPDAASFRLRVRRSYGCDCSGPVGPGRIEPEFTEPQLDAVEGWTGHRPRGGCVWRAMFDPFVKRVLEAYEMAKSGLFAQACPDPSYRLIEGVAYYGRMADLCDAQKQREDEQNRRKQGER